MAATLDHLLTIYPFEPSYFKETDLPVDYIGHPLAETISRYQYREDWSLNLGIRDKSQTIALFPGGRAAEIQRNLPIQLETAKRLRKDFPKVQFAISTAQQEHQELINGLIRETQDAELLDIVFIPGRFNYELMRDCRMAIAKSGTITLELALHACPTVVIYRLTFDNRFIAKYVLRLNLPYYCIVNILKGSSVFPELIAQECLPLDVYRQALKLYREGGPRQDCIAACREVQSMLTSSDSSQKAAQLIFEGRG